MYLVDTNVISELRRGSKANSGVRDFFEVCAKNNSALYLSVVTIGELKRGVDLIRHRGDHEQAQLLMDWLDQVILNYKHFILPVTTEISISWGSLRVPHPQNALDKLIAATAQHHQLTVVTRNKKDFAGLPIDVLNPFTP